MKKIGIYTLNSNDNYGNKLQNYALKKSIEKYGYNVETIWFEEEYSLIKTIIKEILFHNKKYHRQTKFEKFTRKYLNRKIFNGDSNYYDYFVVGSDQVWNYNFKGVKNKLSKYFLKFSPMKKNIAYAASIGVDTIDDKFREKFIDGMKNIKNISVREDQAAIALKDGITDKEIEVVLDPTMLLTKEEWEKIMKKPKQIKNKKYILNYFLGEQSIEKKSVIEKIAQENDCEIINILDKNDPYYTCDPSEFLYLEKNAFLICTDSFHSSVFSIIFDRPFVVFYREQDGVKSMGSRIDTLISKFCLENRVYNGKKITKENLSHNYSKAYKILEKEKEKSLKFIEKSLDIYNGGE